MIRSILIACAVFGLAACGGDDGDDNGGTPDAGGGVDPVEELSEANCPATVAQTVTTTGMAFTNGTITIQAGQVIKFTTGGNHDMTSTGSVMWKSGNPGQTGCLRFNTAGTYPFDCSVHANMTGVVTVQ